MFISLNLYSSVSLYICISVSSSLTRVDILKFVLQGVMLGVLHAMYTSIPDQYFRPAYSDLKGLFTSLLNFKVDSPEPGCTAYLSVCVFR